MDISNLFRNKKSERKIQSTDVTQTNRHVCERCGIDLHLIDQNQIVTMEGKQYCNICAEKIRTTGPSPKETCEACHSVFSASEMKLIHERKLCIKCYSEYLAEEHAKAKTAEKKLKQMTEWIKDDCRHFGVEESYIYGIERNILITHNCKDDYYFYYDNDLGYVLTYWERGFCNWGMGSLDDLGFRFLFQRHIILNDFQSIPKSERFMSDAYSLFGGTQEYKDAEIMLKKKKFKRHTDPLRTQVICKFAGISLDMNYILCIPSVHATYQSEEMTVDFSGNIREISDFFPEDKAMLVVKWVNLHKEEIQNNHIRINSKNEPPLMIEPLQF